MNKQLTLRLIALLAGFGISLSARADGVDYSIRNRSEIGPGDYLFQQESVRRDPVFDNYRPVDLGVNLGLGSDCGRVDFKNTLQASLKNVLDSRYFEDVGKDILAGSPMLMACYFSPTWCAILKHSQINANFMSQMRLNQCQLMDKYTDSRVSDFYEERQKCVHQEIAKNGGNMEAAMQTCGSGSLYDRAITNWSGSKYGDQADTNKLIESSARWAGFTTPESAKTLSLVKNLVGDTVINRGRVSVEYGDKPDGLTPRTHLASVERDVRTKLCDQFLSKVHSVSPGQVNQLVQTADLKTLSGSSEGDPVLDRQTLRNLAYLPYRQRALYCGRLANTVALARFSDEMNRALDVLSTVAQNPNLPDSRRQELNAKRESLRSSIEATLRLQEERNSPLNQVMSQINQEGSIVREDLSRERLSIESGQMRERSARSFFFDCSDGVLCERARGSK